MNLIPQAYQRLFPNKEFSYHSEMEYNRRLSPFNGNIRLHHNTIQVNLNLQWKDIDDEIKIGLIQTLLVKILRQKVSSPNIDLYHHFIKNIPMFTPKNKTDPLLEPSFKRVNEQFFFNHMELPNLEWGQPSFRKLASYNFHNDTVTVSTLFQNTRPEILDYLMYHELLHKHHKFSHRNGRSSYHSSSFRADEARFPQQKQLEQEINQLIRSKRRLVKKSFWDTWWE